MKKPMRKLLHAQGNIHDRVTKLRTELDEVKTALDRNPSSTMLREEDGVYLTAFTQALLDEERFLKQKAKINWLKVGDSNSAFFHRSVKARVSRTRTKSSTTTLNQVGLFGRELNASKAEAMIRELINEEIKRDMFSIVHDFFVNGKLLQEVNHTILTLLPKVHSAKITFDVLEEFKEASGLVPSTPKSTIFLCNVLDQVKSSILNLMPFKEGILPIKAINTGGFNMQEKVVDIVHENAWEDGIYLKLQDGSLKNYYVREIWNDICGRGTNVAWHSFVWSNYGIPGHAIHVWLVMRKGLKTQDRLRKWDVGNDVDLNLLRCPLCKLQPDSHEHLFFECSYSSNAWKSVLRVPEFLDIPPIWTDIMAWIVPLAETNNVTCIVGSLIVVAMSYYVWQERNHRVHGKNTRTREDLTNIIVDVIRSKLASISFKKKMLVDNMKRIWKLPWLEQNVNTGKQNVNTVRARGFNAVKPSACWVWRPIKPNRASLSNSQLNDKGFVDSGCSRHMTGNIAHLSDFKDFDGGYVTFGGGAYGGRITGKVKQGVSDSSTSSQQDSGIDCNANFGRKIHSIVMNAPRSIAFLRIMGLPDQQGLILPATPEVNTGIVIGEHSTSYALPTTPQSEFTKIHPIEHVQQKKKGIFISQDKYVHEILRKYNYTDVKSASTPTDLEKPLVQDGDAAEIPKGKPSLGLWYLKDSPLKLVAYTNSDYAGATQDRKSTTEGSLDTKPTARLWNEALASPEQTATGKDFSNPFIVGSLLKTIWLSLHHVFLMKQWLVQSKRLLPSFIHKRSNPTQYLTSLLMATLEFCDKHNMVAFLEKSTGSAGFHQIIDFISQSHICYALTKKPEVCVSFIKQFWRTAEILTDDNALNGLYLSLPTTEIFAQLALMGYATESDKLTFQKGAFSPQWRFLIHTILHCLSPKKTAWEQFSSNIAAAVICLATSRKKSLVKKFQPVSTKAEATLSTAGGTVTYSRRSTEKRLRKDKGKAILIEDRASEKASDIRKVSLKRKGRCLLKIKSTEKIEEEPVCNTRGKMDVKSAFLYGKIKEEVYVCQPSGFEDPDFPDRVYKVEKDLYGLHQAPRAWYETLSTYLLENRSTKKMLCTEFEKMMHKKSQMSFMDGEDIDEHMYRSMIGSLMYLTSSRPDIMFVVCVLVERCECRCGLDNLKATCVCSCGYILEKEGERELSLDRKSTNKRFCLLGVGANLISCNARSRLGVLYFQVKLEGGKKEEGEGNGLMWDGSVYKSLLIDGKMIVVLLMKHIMMKNLDSAVKFLMYPRFVQVFLDNQMEGMINHNRIYIAPSHTKKVFANMKRQGKDFSCRVTPLFSTMMVQAQQEQGEGSDMPTITQPSSSQPQKKHKPRKPKKNDTQISNVPSDNLADEAVNEENVSKHSNDPLLNGEDRLKLEELMALCTKLQNKVLYLEHIKTTQALDIDNLKRRVKKLKKKQKSRTHGLRRLYKVGLSARVVSSKDVGQDMTEKVVNTTNPVTTAGEVVTTANDGAQRLTTSSFANVQELFDKAMKRVNTFVDMDTELVRDSEVRASQKLDRVGREVLGQ
ncbi:putative ribonuclease H-like domain-containing protein [Tanacetum coccineum]|uniref:Ribonuclease H-like domain-containing protein n=1 Tax=Tanacetum coccineum TaxID=301880 RepID=A0ABQ5B2D9_9ASTR